MRYELVLHWNLSLCRVLDVLLMSALAGCRHPPPPLSPVNNPVIYVCFQAVFLTMALTPDLGLVPRHCTRAANGSPDLQVTRTDVPFYMCPHEHTNMQLLFQIQMSCVLCVRSNIFNLRFSCYYIDVMLCSQNTHTLFSVRIHHFYRRKI